MACLGRTRHIGAVGRPDKKGSPLSCIVAGGGLARAPPLRRAWGPEDPSCLMEREEERKAISLFPVPLRQRPARSTYSAPHASTTRAEGRRCKRYKTSAGAPVVRSPGRRNTSLALAVVSRDAGRRGRRLHSVHSSRAQPEATVRRLPAVYCGVCQVRLSPPSALPDGKGEGGTVPRFMGIGKGFPSPLCAPTTCGSFHGCRPVGSRRCHLGQPGQTQP